ncbi:chorismate lyase [Pseudomonas sp. BCRC 81390]|uniref:chorismate--pyruvate lyase family protein n=1 Tax=Pseudomonas sp. BCRC 81390 TaxID=3054778 RepID=UPI0025969367|nr:chorismate lyase [Pseudomonas sp. BCRC 81390]MDM3888023.1 chorismate lyase [Pseudomonas sp. BCRC 81390]
MDDLWTSRPLPGLSEDQRHWLSAPGSLTLRLKALGQFSLDLVGQSVASAEPGEACALGIAQGQAVWLREVALRVDGEVMVCARSLTPLQASQPAWPELAGLGDQPLGSMLYSSPDIHREAFECQRPQAESPLSRLARQLGQPSRGLLARRSRFMRNGKPLLIAECFVPQFWELVQQDSAPFKLAI